MSFDKKLLPLFLLLAGWAFAQNYQFPKSKKPYLVVDLSKTLAGNELHDRLHYLATGSDDVELPEFIVTLLEGINDEEMYHLKITFQRTAYLRIIYNENVDPADKEFVCDYILKSSNGVFEHVKPIFRAYKEKLE